MLIYIYHKDLSEACLQTSKVRCGQEQLYIVYNMLGVNKGLLLAVLTF
jgi:hypothetical protein